MASVWIARQTGKHGFEKLVAVKTVLPKFASDERFQSMFLDEARIASRIEHVHVAQILDVGEQLDTTYLVMEYVDGEALSTIHRTLKKKGARMPPGVLLRIMADVCGGLHAAHELRDDAGHLLNVVHRDVSPQNVLCSMRGVAKLIDFGVAKARDRIAGDTNAGTVKGKVRYMAPEQALGREIDRRADLWGIGAILYHLLSGKPPYDGENDVQTLLVLTSGRPPVPLPMSVPRPVAAVVKKALSPSPDGRFATAAEMQQAIEEAMAEAKLTTTPQAVAAFLAEHIADRAQRRKDAIALGVKAASDREKYDELMRSNLKSTGSFSSTSLSGVHAGVHMTGSHPGVVVPGADIPAIPSVAAAVGGSHPGLSSPGMSSPDGSGPGTSQPGGSAPGGSTPGQSRPGVSSPGASAPGTAPSSNGTLGSAALELGPRRHLNRRTIAIAGGALGLVGIAAVAFALGARHESSGTAGSGTARPASGEIGMAGGNGIPSPTATAGGNGVARANGGGNGIAKATAGENGVATAPPTATAAPTPAPSPAPTPDSPPAPTARTVSITDLPAAAPTPTTPPAAAAPRPVVAAPVRPAAKPTTKSKQRIDDGF